MKGAGEGVESRLMKGVGEGEESHLMEGVGEGDESCLMEGVGVGEGEGVLGRQTMKKSAHNVHWVKEEGEGVHLE